MAKRKKPAKKILTPKEADFLKRRLANPKGYASQDAIKAGYSPKHPSASATAAMRQLRAAMPELMERMGLDAESLLRDHLIPLLHNQETKFFPYRVDDYKTTQKIDKKTGRVLTTTKRTTKQKIDTRITHNLQVHSDVLDMAFRLGGHYAAENLPPAPNLGVRVVIVPGAPRPGGRQIAMDAESLEQPKVIEANGNGHKPENVNGNGQ
jgi:hypothetical protein